MKKQSAGILLYRENKKQLEVFLVHPGGPFWAKKDAHSWSIPKGEFTDDEDPMHAAKREFSEETGFEAPEGMAIPLGSAKQSSGKVVHAWAVRGNCDPGAVKSNLCDVEWPPKSGQIQQFPEVDRAGWFTLPVAVEKVVKGQIPLLESFAKEQAISFTLAAEPEDEQTSLF